MKSGLAAAFKASERVEHPTFKIQIDHLLSWPLKACFAFKVDAYWV
jgi:hypothetical protein